MAKIQDEVLFDARLVERHIRKGLITRKQYEDYLAKIKDSEANAEVLNLDELMASRPAPVASESLHGRGQSWGPRGDTDV